MKSSNTSFVLNVLYLIIVCIHSCYLRIPPYVAIFVACAYIAGWYWTGDSPMVCFQNDPMEGIAPLTNESETPVGPWECSRTYIQYMLRDMAYYTFLFNTYIEYRREKNLKRQKKVEEDVNEKV